MKKKFIKKYKQSTVESCLACCLLTLIGQKPTRAKEISMLFDALQYNPDDFVTGHIEHVMRKYKKELIRYVHNNPLYNHLKKARCKEKVVQRKIDMNIIDELLHRGTIAISLNARHFGKVYHYPHWVLLLNKKRKKYVVYDPHTGIVNTITEKRLKESIKSYLIRLWMAPQIIAQNL